MTLCGCRVSGDAGGSDDEGGSLDGDVGRLDDLHRPLLRTGSPAQLAAGADGPLGGLGVRGVPAA